jgi:cardiolipin synthase A/B
MELSTITFTLPQILTALFVVYLFFVLGIILLDNRTPQSTFAWLFLMLAFPVIGLLVYLFTGRGHKAFSRENKLARLSGLTSSHGLVIQPLWDAQAAYVEKIRLEKLRSYRLALLQLIQRNLPSSDHRL